MINPEAVFPDLSLRNATFRNQNIDVWLYL